jgi:hypothetical protein
MSASSVERAARLHQLPKAVTGEPPVRRRESISAEDETAMTDIRIAPDGRVFVFGASGQILEMLSQLGWGDDNLQKRIESLSQ